MPWCYTLDPNVIDDVCDIPLCSYEDCRITGPGMEYSGHINRTASDRACVPWSEKFVHKYEADTNATLLPSDEHKRKLPDYRFPEGSRKRAMNRCRNPNADPAGPWCLVERETLAKTSYDVEYCNVPFCEQPECPSYTRGDSSSNLVHTHYSSTLLSEDDSTILFGLRLWNPEQWRNARFRLALSMVPIAATGKRLREMNVGLELIVQHNGSELQLTDDEVWK
ncbi:hepatocyte growth factor-like [Diaphorina citri]|uniref:Hepatocyte growth factor-like n=1 Tax=Diaphorina citri TaxID=121845 RepID=A0A3Q0IUU8_DIACI|nr:hepatocyte growth factor-like [Diaphorina citri]